MNTEKFMKASLLLAMTTLIALGGLWQPAAAKSGIFRLHENETIAQVRQGIHATNIPVGVTSVYLDMVGGKLPARFNQKVDIEYRIWELCPTFFVDESRDNGTADRLACLAPASGYYALGHGDFGELLAKPASAEKATGAGLASKFVPQ
jgi:hypothetical protein